MTVAGALMPPAVLGVVGGGQLGRMFVQAAARLGYRTVALVGDRDDPAAQVAGSVIVGASDDPAAIQALAEAAQAVTVEFENVSAPALRWLERWLPTRPGWRSVWVSQDRLREKSFLNEHGFATAPWRAARSEAEATTAAEALGGRAILKTAASGYDGKGQIRISSPKDAAEAWRRLGGVACVAEGIVSFAAELAVVAARGDDGETATYPPTWNRHVRHVLDTACAPAPIGPALTSRARAQAAGIAEALGHVGVLTVEFFVGTEGDLVVNELAPRPHNSGHLTIEAGECSQFEQQARALAGLPLGSTRLLRPAAMANLLGDLWGQGPPRWERALRGDPGIALHLYGKRDPAPGRKMGHLTATDVDPEAALARVRAARGAL